MLFNLMFLAVGCFSQSQELPSAGTVQDLQRPTIAIDPSDGVFEKGDAARIECRSPGYHLGSSFYLMRDGQGTAILQKNVPDSEDTASFDFVNLTRKHQGNYRCFYRKQESGQWRSSAFSTPVQIIVQDDPLETQSPEPPRAQGNIWTLTGIAAGGVVLILIITATVWYICRKKSKSRWSRNDAGNLWTTYDDNINNPQAVNTRHSFRFSQELERPRQEEEGNAYYSNQSTEFLNDTQLTPTGLHQKPYFATFRE